MTNREKLMKNIEDISIYVSKCDELQLLSLVKVNELLESSAVLSRNLIEQERSKTALVNDSKLPSLPYIELAGKVRIIEQTWLHIKLNTLLPNCRFQTPLYISDTITRLLDNFELKGGRIPFYENAMLVIDEHCNISNRTVFDQDNKGWKAVSNALKGRLFPDDDQFSMGVSMISKISDDFSCNIYVMNIHDAGDFFGLRNEDLLF